MKGKVLAGVCAILLSAGLIVPSHSRGQDDELTLVLNVRAKAFLEGDRDQFLSLLDPGAAEFRTAQELMFDRSRSIPFAGYSLKLDEDAPLLTRKADKEKYGPETVVAAIEERFQIAGFDTKPALGRLLFTFVKRQGKWLIASDSPLDDLGLYSARHPWDFAPIEVKTSEHFMMILHPQDAAFASELLSLAEQALPNVDRVFKRGWSKSVVIYVPATKRELERIIDATFDVDPFVAFASAAIERDENWVSLAPRVILSPDNFLRHTPASRRAIFAHELLHIATRDSSGPFVSAFVEEGFARIAQSQNDRSFRRAFRNTDIRLKLPEDVEFVTGGPRSIEETYHRAHSFSVFIQETFGLEKLNEFYVKLGSFRSDAGTARYQFDAASREVLGLSLSDVEAKWTAYVTSG